MPKFFSDRIDFDAAVFHPTYLNDWSTLAAEVGDSHGDRRRPPSATGGPRGAADAPDGGAPPGIGPYALALRRLRRNKAALAFGALFLLIVVLCLLRAGVRRARRAHRARTPTT